MKVIQINKKDLTILIEGVIKEAKFNQVNFMDLTKSGDWDARRHSREEKGVHMFKLENGLLKKIERHPNHTTVDIYYLTDKEANKSNEFLSKAKKLESDAKELREMAKFIYKSGLEG
jgi:hypothetical protein